MTSPQPPSQPTNARSAAQSAKRLQDTKETLKAQARSIKDPAERERLWHAAYNNEVEANGDSKKARVMASGWGQGAAGGVGISSAVGMGLGNVVGAVTSGVVSVPGALVGAAVGAVHGPWYAVRGEEGDGKGDGKGVVVDRKEEADGKGD